MALQGRIRNTGTTKVGGISKKLVKMLWICHDKRKKICEQKSDVCVGEEKKTKAEVYGQHQTLTEKGASDENAQCRAIETLEATRTKHTKA